VANETAMIEDDDPAINEPKLVDELKKMEYEPLLPIEKKLIVGSLVLGVALLGILLWVSRLFFPG
jgi:hypothetical protein